METDKAVETEKLVEQLVQATSIDDYLDAFGTHCQEGFSFSQCFELLFQKKNLRKMEIIERSGLDTVYAHEMIRGKKRPARDKVLLISLGMGLTVPETQLLLRHSGYSPLTPKLRRDAVVLFAVTHGITVAEMNDLMDENGLPLVL